MLSVCYIDRMELDEKFALSKLYVDLIACFDYLVWVIAGYY